VINMPNKDKTGPNGAGPGTGRGMGSCVGDYKGGLGRGRGYGRAMCGWFYRRYQAMPEAERKDVLKEEVEDLKNELEMVEAELKGLEKNNQS
jgi:hypothetical protein